MSTGRARTPGFVYLGVGVALLAVLATIALTTRQPPPPTIAEFAPQAVERIEDAPDEQSSESGTAEGGPGGGASTPPPEEQIVYEVARLRRCVGNPPRQIEDPQSPPCVPYWEGNNGGSTWKGVTKDEIRIMVPTGNPDQSASPDLFPILERFFNQRFTFYGRRLKFVYGGVYPNAGTRDVAAQVAAAVEADEEKKVFASLRWRTSQGFHYHEELARRKVPSVTGVEWGYDTDYLRARAPHVWTYVMETDRMFANVGEWMCSRLVGRNAKHSGDFTGQRRRFGLVLQTYYNSERTRLDALAQRLSSCGGSPAVVLTNPIQAASGREDDQPQPDSASAVNVVLQLKREGVTSVFCACQPYASGELMRAATTQAYFPEWLYSSYGAQDIIWGVRLGQAPVEQMRHALGVTFTPRQIPPENEPYLWAAKEGDPNFPTPSGYGPTAIFNFTYRQILLLASGIQMAGPNLTPATFADGLQRSVFPNPEHPNRPGKVGFEEARFAMTTDGAEWWWSPTATSAYGQAGTHCYLDGGARRRLGSWPKTEGKFFSGTCQSGAR